VGQGLASQPPRRLVLTWANPQDKANKARHSRVTFEIEPVAEMVRLTITHDELEAGSDTLRKISDGWPRVLSSLKSLLETGRHSKPGPVTECAGCRKLAATLMQQPERSGLRDSPF
jgi:activator of Hsp90 ATPase-like protein